MMIESVFPGGPEPDVSLEARTNKKEAAALHQRRVCRAACSLSRP